ncbi:MAG: ABC transporter ATP-binding protein [Planctomycetes bacterium]|nr:ABC transporter ATP-binding protein [Planctomycetota bacterium]
MNALAAKNLSLQRGKRIVLDGVDLTMRPGELVLLAGRNGAGKSTLMRLLLGAERPAKGTVTLHDRPLAEWPALARARELAFVPQEAESHFEFTGRELVTMGRHPHRARSMSLQPDDFAAVERALSAVDALPFADRAVTTLSSGEQRRIAVARALATEAQLLLLDEPTSNLDLEHALQLVVLLKKLAAAGRGVLIASHDLNLLARHCDRVVLLHEGRVFADASPEQAFSVANMATVFGVQSLAPSSYFPRDFSL